MKILVLKSTVADGKNLVAGKEATVSDKDARFLIALGKAEEVKEKSKAKKEPESNKAVSGDELETR